MPLPALRYRASGGSNTLAADGRARPLVVLFDTHCGHCAYEFAQMDRQLSRFAGTHLYLLTAEDSLSMRDVARRWPLLATSPNVTWAMVDAAAFRRVFGPLVTPAIYVFDARGRLERTFHGETRIELLVSPMTSAN
ncbi:MAG: hypothetical protein ABJE47_07535 [bacterium]